MDEFTAEFKRRLSRLDFCLNYYYETGKVGNLLPALASCFTYLWCRSPFKKSRK